MVSPLSINTPRLRTDDFGITLCPAIVNDISADLDLRQGGNYAFITFYGHINLRVIRITMVLHFMPSNNIADRSCIYIGYTIGPSTDPCERHISRRNQSTLRYPLCDSVR